VRVPIERSSGALDSHDAFDRASPLQIAKEFAGFLRFEPAKRRAGLDRLSHDFARNPDGRPFWIVGLDDQLAFAPVIENWRDPLGADDLSAALAQVTDDAPIILLAHEPDIFAEVPQQAALTLCGHLHAGQCNLFGFTPFVPREYWGKPIYGHTVDNDRHLIISGGLGCSAVPMRIGAPPEIVVVDLGGADVASIPSLPLRGVG